jgi:hypothetical protein
MSARENLSSLLATRGKGGSLESISQAGKHFSTDKTLTPSDFITVDKLDASKAITLLGGFAVSTYGLDPKVAYSMRNAFAKKYAQVVNLYDLSQADFISAISEIDAEIATEASNKANFAISMGTEQERLIKNAQSAIDKLVDANVSPKVKHDLLTLARTIEQKLAYAPVQKVAQVA